jgi:hypothetical protein
LSSIFAPSLQMAHIPSPLCRFRFRKRRNSLSSSPLGVPRYQHGVNIFHLPGSGMEAKIRSLRFLSYLWCRELSSDPIKKIHSLVGKVSCPPRSKLSFSSRPARTLPPPSFSFSLTHTYMTLSLTHTHTHNCSSRQEGSDDNKGVC